MWTWDSVDITHDQTCWTYDGYNGCEQEYSTLLGSGGPGHYQEMLREIEVEQILSEDMDIVDFLKAIVTRGLL